MASTTPTARTKATSWARPSSSPTTRWAFLVNQTTGIVCAPMLIAHADRLATPVMVPPDENTDAHGTAFTVTTDLLGTGTEVSAADRAATVRGLADLATRPD